jgi:hypothetical protein
MKAKPPVVETVKTYQGGVMTEREIVRYVDIAASCCVVRVHGYDDADPKEQWRWMNIDLLSTHEPWKMSWRKRLRYAWFTLRYGTAIAPFIELIRPEEADHLIDAMQHARIIAFGPANTRKGYSDGV